MNEELFQAVIFYCLRLFTKEEKYSEHRTKGHDSSVEPHTNNE